MVPAKPKDTIGHFLTEVARSYHIKHAPKTIKCTQLLVEDQYEVDERYSCEECLGDMLRVIVLAQEMIQPAK